MKHLLPVLGLSLAVLSTDVHGHLLKDHIVFEEANEVAEWEGHEVDPEEIAQVLLEEGEEEQEEDEWPGTSYAQTFGAEIELSMWSVLADGVQKGSPLWKGGDGKSEIVAETQGSQGRMGIENIILPVTLNKSGRRALKKAVDSIGRKNAQMSMEAAYMAKSDRKLREWIHRSQACRANGEAQRIIAAIPQEDTKYLDMTFREAFEILNGSDMDVAKAAKRVVYKAAFFCTCRLSKGGMMKFNDSPFPIGPPIGMSKSGAGSGRGTTNWMKMAAYDLEPREMIIGNPQVTAAVNIQAAGLSLWNHQDFDYALNQEQTGSMPLPFPDVIKEEIGRLVKEGESYMKKPGADAYIGWLSYYVFAIGMSDGAKQSRDCTLANPKDSVLGFNVRTKFKEIHEYLDTQKPTDATLPTGDELFELVWGIAKKGWTNGDFPSKMNGQPCDPAQFRLGGAVQQSTVMLKDMIASLPGEDKFTQADPSLGKYPLQDTNGQKALIIEFRTPKMLCGKNEDRFRPLPTITWWRDYLLRYFDFFRSFNDWSRSNNFASNRNVPRMDLTSRCSPRTWGFYSRGMFPRVCHASCKDDGSDCTVTPNAKFSTVG
uniref:Uncharacterized protein n=1 Tax=Chromera velia CCMP2878 TaxID=1169474 RepID=A0A0G4GY56_9ALVE|eukprot:Cvel_23863.t1-p1 / transcript=Cvel_23863.t1 / gene=Cvel_23863 / organism=Chromera_velia_CCMP2878 / gene_product=hypothetical protein / transcript_product=hypothetical protein / location=Cvel_scaffold2511:11422-13670(+) / protein_length=597 / sequence_SO=supercontig / SO=protein_coding / is_pseudo=false